MIFAINLALSGIYLYQLYETELIDLNFKDGFDSLTYHNRGISVAQGDPTWLKSKQALYPVVVGGIYALFGVKPFFVFALQAILLALECIILYALGKEIFNPTVGLLAALIYSVYPISIFYTGFLLRVTVITFLDLLMVYVLTLTLGKKGLLWYALTIVICALAVSGRYNIMLFIGAFFLWFFLLYKGYIKRIGPSNPVAFTGLVFFLPVFAIIFWSQAYDVSKMAQWIAGNSYDSTGFYHTPKQGLIPFFSLDFFLKQMHKAFLFFNTFEAPNNLNFYLLREKATVLQFLQFSFGIIFPFALVGFVSALKNKERIIPLILFVVCYSISVIVFFVSSRHRLPLVPILILMMAYGINTLVIGLRKNKQRSVGFQIALLIAVLLISAWETQHIKQSKRIFNAAHRLPFSHLYLDKAKYGLAERELQAAIAELPSFQPAYLSLAYLYSEQGHNGKVVATCDEGLSLGPHPKLHFIKGTALFELDRLGEAVEEFRRVIALEPQYWKAYLNIAQIGLKTGNYFESIEYCNKILTLNSGLAEAHYIRAQALINTGNGKEAEAAIRKALILKANDPRFYEALGKTLILTKHYEKAQLAFLKALSLGSNHAEIHFNLGVLYGEHIMDNTKAIHHLEKSLEHSLPESDRIRAEILLKRIRFKK